MLLNRIVNISYYAKITGHKICREDSKRQDILLAPFNLESKKKIINSYFFCDLNKVKTFFSNNEFKRF